MGLHARLVRRSLERGFYQGWDLHPHQLPTRYAATYAFYRDGLARRLPAAARLPRQAAGERPGRAGHRPGPGGLLVRGLDCGALDETELPFGRPELEKYALRLA